MDFELNEQQQMLKETVAEFAKEKIAPVARQYDESAEFPFEIIREMGKLDLLGVLIDEKYGGAGLGALDFVIVMEEISKVDASVGVTLGVQNSLGITVLQNYGSEEQKKKYLPKIASGEIITAFGLTEPMAGSDVTVLDTTAVKEGGEWVINGLKCFITNGGVADLVTVLATSNKARGTRGISAFLVEKGTPGYSIGKKEDKMGIRASDTSELVFENCRIPEANLVGREGIGFKAFLEALDSGRIGIGAQALGIAEGAYEAALKYSKERVQFGSQIGRFQGMSWMLADMATQINAAKWMVYHAAWLKDMKRPYAKEAAMAKLFASEVSRDVVHKALQVHGGYGFMKDYDVERFYRDQRITEIYEGTSEIQRNVIASAILK